MKPVALLFIEEKLWSWTLALTGSWYFAGNQLFCWQWPVSNPTNKWRIIDHLWLKVNRLHRGFPTVGRDEIWNILLITQAKLLILRMENFSVVRFGPSVRQSHGGDYWTCLSQRYLDNILPATAHPEMVVSLIMSRLCQVKKLLSSSWESWGWNW